MFYAGGNDINSGKKADRVLSDFRAFVQKVHARLPATHIAFISIAWNPARWSQVEEVKSANKRIEEYTKSDPRLAFINVFPHMLADDGLPKLEHLCGRPAAHEFKGVTQNLEGTGWKHFHLKLVPSETL